MKKPLPEIVRLRPPNYEEIRAAFGPLPLNIVFAYGGKIYSPSRSDLPPDLIVHEKIHLRQQDEMGSQEWWKLYIEDAEFRLAQEIEAYRAQLASISVKRLRREAARRFAIDLSSSMYGHMIYRRQAWELITN